MSSRQQRYLARQTLSCASDALSVLGPMYKQIGNMGAQLSRLKSDPANAKIRDWIMAAEDGLDKAVEALNEASKVVLKK